VPDEAWAIDAETRRSSGRVQIFNATRPGGLDGWTMDARQYQAVHDLILEIIDDDGELDGTVRLQHVVDTIQHRLGDTLPVPEGSADQLRQVHHDRHGSTLRDRTPPRFVTATHHPVANPRLT
jgi:hypothetical protein